MVFLISMGIAVIFILACRELLRRRPVPFYIAAVLLAAAVVWVTWKNVRLPDAVNTWLWPVLSRGGLGGAFFVIVMITGAFPNGSKPVKWLMPVRGQLSILASILTLGHNAAYGKTYFVLLLTQPDTLPMNQLLAAVCSVIMIVIMLPLFVTSFKTIRKRMKPKNWKKLQRLAYLFYSLLCAHILLLTVPGAVSGRSGYRLTVFVYGTVFAGYAVCRILKAWYMKKKDVGTLVHRQRVGVFCCGAFVFLFVTCLSVGLLPHPAKTKEESIESAVTGTTEEAEDAAASAGIYRDGVYTGSAMGMNAEITVSVTIESDVIVDIKIDSARDDEPYFTDAKAVIADILKSNSTDVDTVSGATYSSGGMIDAVEDALKKARNAEAHSAAIFAMDTVMELTVYGDETLLEQAEKRIFELEGKLSVTDEKSEIARLNLNGGGAVSADTLELLKQTLILCKDSEGALDISIYPVLKAWGFTTGDYRVPAEEEIKTLLEAVDYRDICIQEDGSVALASGMEIDLGSVAKGYASDCLVELFTENGVDSGILNLGGNVYALGSKPDGASWRVAITDPEEGGYAGSVEVSDKAIITSGGYERYFEQDGVRYHHIIDPATGRPAENGFLSVTVIGDNGLICDALSTALFVMGPDKAAEFWKERGGFEAVFITSEGICITEGLEENFSPLGTYQNEKATVLRHD